MSNNIYDILKKIENLEGSRQTLTEGMKAKPDYIDIDKDGDKKEPMKKAAKDKAKGGMAEAVARVEQQLSEKYMGFKKTVAAIKKGGSAENPEAVAAAIGRKKYGKEKFQKAAAAGKKLGEGVADLFIDTEKLAQQKAKADQSFANRVGKYMGQQIGDQYHQQLMQTMPSYRDEFMARAKDTRYDKLDSLAKALQAKHDPMGGPTNIDYEKIKKDPMPTRAGEQGVDWRPFGPGPKEYFGSDEFGRPMKEGEMEESGLQAYLGKKKYGEEGMKALQQAGREGASKEKMAKIRARHDKMDEDAYNEDMLSPKEKSFAALAEPKDKITHADKIAGAKKGKKTEGNKFSGNLMKARAQGLKRADLDGDGDMEPVREGSDGPEYQKAWERTQAERKSWEQSHPGEKYYSSPKSPVERHSMEIAKARDADQAAKDEKRGPLGRIANTLSRGLFGQEIDEGRTSMREGWEEMQKYLEKKKGPQSKGGEGKKAGTRYGGSAQKDDDEDLDSEGQPAVKKKGRPKGTGGGAKFNFKKPKD